jgi:hypothetical protein
MKKLLAISLFTLAAPIVGYAQGCAMCYTAAAQQSAAGKHALNVGILFLLMPALSIFCGVVYAAWKYSGDGLEEIEEEGL